MSRHSRQMKRALIHSRQVSRMLIVALAGARLTRAWLHESIGEPFREALIDKLTPDYTSLVSPAELMLRDKATDLITCPHCIGFWFTLLCSVGYRIPIARTVVVALAAAMIQSAIVDHYPRFDHVEPSED